jgi:hypothetical protein
MADSFRCAPDRAAWVAVVALLAACSPSYYELYRSRHPDWTGAFPVPGISLTETIAALHAPADGDYQVTVSKLWIFRTDTRLWIPIRSGDSRTRKIAPEETASYAVAAEVWCFSRVGSERYEGRHVSWYLLPGNRLAAWDHYEFGERCALTDHYRPASGANLETELALRRDVTEPRGQSPTHAFQLYNRGLRLVEVGRVAEAAQMLARADTLIGLDPAVAVTEEDTTLPYPRARLVEALERALSRRDCAPSECGREN